MKLHAFDVQLSAYFVTQLCHDIEQGPVVQN